MRKTRYLVLLALLLSLSLAGVANARPAAATAAVTIQGFQFNPGTTTIMVGDTVTWTNNDTAPHTATSISGPASFNSGTLNQGQSFSFTFNTAGSYQYVCQFHDTMSGTIVVQQQAPTATTAPTTAPEATATTAPAAPTATTAPAGPTPLVQANNQPIVNNTVTVAKVVAAQDGWIVIHTDVDNKPGPVIGQTFVRAGEHTNVQVALSQTPAVGAKLWPMLHIDAGTMGTYEFPGADVPVKDAAGNVVMIQITVTQAGPAPLVQANDQPIVNNTVTVAKVVAAQDGWIVIHTNTAENKPGPVIGQTAVRAGENLNVKVTLSQTPAVGDKLWPMLHVDAGTMGTYEFPGADVPVQDAAGNVVMVQIAVTAAPAGLPNTGATGAPSLWLFVALALALLSAGLVVRRRIA